MTAAAVCGTCGTRLRADARFCDGCGAPVVAAAHPEYKQVTVFFADVVHSMDIAAAVGAERLREIMAELINRAAAVVRRYGGAVDKFTGTGVMAVFGAPVALEDHAVRACLAALAVQETTRRLAVEVHDRDGVDLRLRVGLNSGEVITGEVGSPSLGYTAVGEQVGMAQRMASVAPPGGVRLSESTARLVEGTAVLGEPELVHVKGIDAAVATRQLLGMSGRHRFIRHRESTFVGRREEMAALTAILGRSIGGQGCVVGVTGSAGVGKSRLVAEFTEAAAGRDVATLSAFCESYAGDIPFFVVAALLRTAFGIADLGADAARSRLRARSGAADPADLALLEDMLGVGDPAVALPDIVPDARRRRLTALITTVMLAQTTPRVYVIEDVHWIDPVSEALLAEFLAVVHRTPALVVITYRPQYRGPLSTIPGGQTITLAPLNHTQTAALVGELLGTDASVTDLAARIAARAAGNPFFAEEIVRDLADRGVLHGAQGGYVGSDDLGAATVPATVQSAIAARIDRLDPQAKQTLNAAAVIGLRFDPRLLAGLTDTAALPRLVDADLIEQVTLHPRVEYAFRHALIRDVAYQSQLKSERTDLHRRLAAAVAQRNPDTVEQHAALIAEHYEAAGDLTEAFGWHMRAAAWSNNRDIRAARMSWQRARQVADRLPADDPARASMRITPRAMLCGSSFRVAGTIDDAGFDELRQLAEPAGDKMSLAIGMSGYVTTLLMHGHYREASRLASEYTRLVESLGDPNLTVALSLLAMPAKRYTGEATEALRLAEQCISLAGDDTHKGDFIIDSPLANVFSYRGTARCALGLPGWKADIERSRTMMRECDLQIRAFTAMNGYGWGIALGELLPDPPLLQETAEMLQTAEGFGEDVTLTMTRMLHGIALVYQGGAGRDEGLGLLALARAALLRGYNGKHIPVIDAQFAKDKIRTGDLDGAIELSRAVVDQEYACGEIEFRGAASAVLVEALLARGTDADLVEAQAVVDRLAAVPVEPGYILFEPALLGMRARIARARGELTDYREYARRYRELANALGLEGHTAIAETMTSQTAT